MLLLLCCRLHQPNNIFFAAAVGRDTGDTHLTKHTCSRDLSQTRFSILHFRFDLRPDSRCYHRASWLSPRPLGRRTTPHVFTANVKSQSSLVSSVIGAAGVITPSIFTPPSRLPNLSAVDWILPSTDLLLRISVNVDICLSLLGRDWIALSMAFLFISARDIYRASTCEELCCG